MRDEINDVKMKVLVLGAGPIVIGQAGEFDYSGTQACRMLMKLGCKVILVNSNPATIMTDQDTADVVYLEPITCEFVEMVIQKESPDYILPTVGGQTALNCAMELEELGILEKYGTKMIGAQCDAIKKAEDRMLFKDVVERIGLRCPRSVIVSDIQKAEEVLHEIGLPAIIRPSFTLSGYGGGIAYNKEEYITIVGSGLDASPISSVQIDECLLGWKEYEMEVVRDKYDNAVIVCGIENVDPMGVHTGDSITVAPILTLRDEELQQMRNASIDILREIGIETGGANVQFAINPEDGAMVVIEMNPRVSRSSALASKATGFPIAKAAAQLALGYSLRDIKNDAIPKVPLAFEPALDYIVTKIPRFDFEKMKSKGILSSAMKSVGEVMAIGRCFNESIQKALFSLEDDLCGFDDLSKYTDDEVMNNLSIYTYNRILFAAEAMRRGISVEKINEVTKYDLWYLRNINMIIDTENNIKSQEKFLDGVEIMRLKRMGFSDARIAQLSDMMESEFRDLRHQFNVRPVYKKIDTCAAEFQVQTSCLYSTYEGCEAECEAEPSRRSKVIILGSGPNRIGQGVEFDYVCVHGIYALRDMKYEAIMINCNPETVSTDYDTADRLYFEPLTIEHVLEVIHVEQKKGELLGVILQFGGQTPLKLADDLVRNKVKILGTTQDSIDLSEDRGRFYALLDKLGMPRPESAVCHSENDIDGISIQFPILVRPSYILGGRKMNIIYSKDDLRKYFQENSELLEQGILVDRFLSEAIEVDIDAVVDSDGNVYIAGIVEHIEEAGVHSGDSACSLPPYSLPQSRIDQIEEYTSKLARELKIIGLLNIQLAIQGDNIFVLEVNPRASRTIPFICKTTGVAVVKIATQVILGHKLSNMELPKWSDIKGYAVKESVFPFNRFEDVDVVLGPEMKSTGEAMGRDMTFGGAFAKAQIGAGNNIVSSGKVLISVRDEDKDAMIQISRDLIEMGFSIYATGGTAQFLSDRDILVTRVNKVREGRPHILDAMINDDVAFVINTSGGDKSIEDSRSIRRMVVKKKLSYVTTISAARAFVKAMRYCIEDKSSLFDLDN